MKKILTLKSLLLALIVIIANNAFSQSAGDYRSHQTGNWNAASTWERYDGTTWQTPAAPPSSTDGVITIRNTHTVSVIINVTVDQVVIDAGGTISVNTTATTMTIADGPGTDMNVNGKFSVGYSGGNSTYAFAVLNGQMVINNDLEIINRGQLTISSTGSLTVPSGGAIAMSGGNGATRGTLQEDAGGTFNLASGATVTGNLALVILNGTGTVDGTISVSNNSDISIGGTTTVSSSITLGGQTGSGITVTNGGTLSLTGSATIPMTGGNASSNTLDVNSGGTLKLAPNTIISSTLGGVFTLASGGFIEIGSTNGIAQTGNSGHVQTAAPRTFSAGAHYTYNGVAAQITGTGLPGTLTTGSVTINNAAGVTLTNNLTTPTLTLTNGILNGVTNTKTTTIAVGGIVNRTNGWVYGNLAKNVAGGAGIARTFEVGTNLRYNPMTVSFANVTTAGTLTVKTNLGDHAAINSSAIDPAKSVNLNWSAINTGIVFDNFSATFQFANPADKDAAADPANFRVQKYDGATWSAPAGIGTRTATTTQGTGFTSFGDFQVGELAGAGGPGAAYYFRSVVTGNWNDVNTWEWSSDNAIWNPAPAPHTPDHTDLTITIRTPNTVTVTADVTTDETTVNTGGSLNITNGITLSISDGTGFDFTNNGSVNLNRGTLLFKSVNTGSSNSGTASYGPSTGLWSAGNNGVSTGGIVVERVISAPFARSAWRLLTAPLSTLVFGLNSDKIYDNWQNAGVNTAGVDITVTGPAANSAVNGLDYVTPGPSMQMYDMATQQLQPVTNTKTTSLFSKGFFVYINGDRNAVQGSPNQTTLSARGTFPNGGLGGDHTVPTSSTADAFTLVPNPYIAAVDLNLLRQSNAASNIKTNYYYWDPYLTGIYGIGAYVTVSYDALGNETITPAGAEHTRFLQNGQAMFVQTKNPVSGTAALVFHEADKAPNTVNNIFRVSSGKVDGITVDLKVNTGSSSVLVDGIAAKFDNSYAYGVDDYDAIKFSNIGESISFLRNGSLLSVERMPLESNDVLFLNLSKLKTGNAYQLEIKPEITVTGLTAFLIDNYLKTTTQIDLITGLTVDFTVNSDAASTGANRYSILFAKPAAIVSGEPAMSIFPNPVSGGIINLQMKNMPQGIYQAKVYNSLGQVIVNRQINHAGGNSTETIHLGKGSVKGIYQLDVIKPDNSRFSGKVLAN